MGFGYLSISRVSQRLGQADEGGLFHRWVDT